MLYSLVETAKANNLNHFKYFEMLLSVIPQHVDDKNRKFLGALLPWSPVVQENCKSMKKKS